MNSLEQPYKTGQLTNFGNLHHRCEWKLKGKYNGFWLPVTNGSVAIQIALSCLPETVRRIAVPNFTFAATIQAVLRSGRIPVIFEASKSLGFDVDLLHKHRRSFDAVLGVVPFGYDLFDNKRLTEYCHDNDIPLVWDRAGAFPMIDKENICTFSLHASKGLPVGEGGLIYFPTMKLLEYRKARKLICFGFNEEKECVLEDGFNFKMDELRCAVLHWFLENDHLLNERKQNLNRTMMRYKGALYQYCHSVDWSIHKDASLIVLNFKKSRKLQEFLNTQGITARRYYAPLLEQHPAFKRFKFYGAKKKNLNDWLALPSDVTDCEREYIIEKIRSFYRENGC